MLEGIRKSILFCLWFLVGAFFLFVFVQTKVPVVAGPMRYGVTFTPSHARYLGLDWQRLYLAILDDLKVSRLRLSAHWDEIESREGEFDFGELDWMLAEAAKRRRQVVLAVGRKLPRWPECRLPAWARPRQGKDMERLMFSMLETVVNRYRSHPAVEAWQVENEPYFTFGDCPKLRREFYDEEVVLVRRLGAPHPIIATDSGELSSWTTLARRADVLGISMYQMTWNPLLGYFSYPLPPSFYWRKAEFVRAFTGREVMITELQMEPWLPNRSIHDLPYAELEKSFTIERFRDNLAFARAAGFGTQYLWGVEWWAWAAQRGHPEFWEEARKLWM